MTGELARATLLSFEEKGIPVMRYRWLVASGVGLLVLAGTALGAGYGSHMGAGMMQAQGMSQASSDRQFHGRIAGVDRGHHWFYMRTSKSGLVRMGVATTTRFYGCSWGAMRAGRHVYVHASRHHGSRIAMSVRPWQGNWDDNWGDMGDHMGYGWGD